MSIKFALLTLLIVTATISYSYALENAVVPNEPEEIDAQTLPGVASVPTNQITNMANEEISDDDDFVNDIDAENATIGMSSMQATEEGSNVEGEADFVETSDGLSINIEVFNVPNPGKHGHGHPSRGGYFAGTRNFPCEEISLGKVARSFWQT